MNKILSYFKILIAVFISFRNKKIEGLEVPDIKTWNKNFRKRALSSGGEWSFRVLPEFVKSNIYIKKELGFKNNKNLIVICVIKNDLERLKEFLKHYRKLGIAQFAFLDDKSNDGTKEFLQTQNDVELFESSEEYKNRRREAWILRILAYYGFNRWYLVADSDELLVYNDFENKSLTKFIDFLEEEKMTAASGMLVDMYAKDKNETSEKNGVYDGVEYFDKNGYFKKENAKISGGMRYRLFDIKVNLCKTPLFFMDNKTLCDAHNVFPFDRNFQKDKKIIALLHYKFLAGDVEKYRERVNKKNMAAGSAEYKKYIEKMDENNLGTFYDEKVSELFTGSGCLVKNGLLD